MNEWRMKAFVDFVAKRIDMDVDDVAHAVEVNIPHVFHDHRASDGAVGIAKKEFEKRVLLHLQIYDVPATPDLPCSGVHFEVGEAKPRVFLSAAPQEGADARREFGEGERLDEIVIGSGIKAGDLIF